MRVLCSCLPGFGHFHPMVPLARALAGAGHEVAFATAPRFCERVVRPAGFPAFAAGVSPVVVEEETARLPEVAGLGPRDVWPFGAHMFAGVAASRKVADLAQVVESWHPDLVVHGAIDFAGPVAAARAGLPWVNHGVGALQPRVFWELSAEVVAPLWAEWGVQPGPLGGMFRHLYLDICPPSFQSPDVALAPSRQPVRPVPFDTVPFDTAAGGGRPSWGGDLPDRPTVYVTMGTIFNSAPGLFEMLLEGVRDEPFNVIVTVGHDRDPEELGPQPANVRVERYLPQSMLFPHCDAVVCHGGSGTVLAALGSGLPLLVVPQGANQFWNAERCAELGVGISLGESEAGPEAVRRGVRALVEEPGYREAAGHLAEEIGHMPSPAEAVPQLERLAGVSP
ncbi:MAG TPA: glycosyltransferase [Acidimicrobiales bacterium]|nr:glycosyltransferase [Acidimicrobiales bacterium]